MHTECSAGLVGFAPSKSQKVLAVFDDERMTSEAGRCRSAPPIGRSE
jgi:hypothetical protein